MSQQRRLVLFPVVHTLKDLGGLAEAVAQARPSHVEKQRFAQAVGGFWDRTERAVDALPVSKLGWRVYQDGLPVCEHEQAIVADLAAGGSRNHRLVRRLMDRGAVLMGTESAELLVEEYQLQKELLEQGADMAPQKRSRTAGSRRRSSCAATASSPSASTRPSHPARPACCSSVSCTRSSRISPPTSK